MAWNYEDIYTELLKADKTIVKEDIFSELARIEQLDSPSVSFLKGQALLDMLEKECGFTLPVRFFIGDELAALCEEALELKRRDAYDDMEDYCHEQTHSKIGILFGLRSTGKTVIMQQLAGRKEHLHETAYATLKYRQCMVRELERHIRSLQAAGIKYVFIDEICYAEGFVEYCAGIADDFPSMKIIVSGTDSLSFDFAKSNAWFHRTWMSYPEFNRIIGGDILDYVKHGGVFEYPNYSLEEYLYSSIINNIYNTVMNIDKMSIGGEIIKSLSKQEFYNIIYAICTSVTINLIKSRASEIWGTTFAHGLDAALKDNALRLESKHYREIISDSYPYHIKDSKYDKEIVEAVIS